MVAKASLFAAPPPNKTRGTERKRPKKKKEKKKRNRTKKRNQPCPEQGRNSSADRKFCTLQRADAAALASHQGLRSSQSALPSAPGSSPVHSSGCPPWILAQERQHGENWSEQKPPQRAPGHSFAPKTKPDLATGSPTQTPRKQHD